MSLSLQLSALTKSLEDTELLWRVHLLTDVVGKDWVIKEEMRRVSSDASVLGLSIPLLLSEWINGTYKNGVLDQYRNWVMMGIDWLITGDSGYINNITDERLVKVRRDIKLAFQGYLEDLYLYELD